MKKVKQPRVFQKFLKSRGNRTYYGLYWVNGKELQPCLKTEDKKTAEEILQSLMEAAAAGRFDVLENFKGKTVAAPLADLIPLYHKYAPIVGRGCNQDARAINIAALGKILKTVRGIERDAISLADISAQVLRDYQSMKVQAAGSDQGKLAAAKRSVNACAHMAKSLFKRSILPCYKQEGIKIPESVLDFMGVADLNVAKVRYVKPAEELMAATLAEAKKLRASDRNAYLAFILAYGAGLRAGEIAYMQYNWIADNGGKYRINIPEADGDFSPKGNDGRPVPMEGWLYDEIKALRIERIEKPGEKAPDFILTGPISERSEKVFRRISAMMKAQGWKTRKKVHEMRKYFGAEVASQLGLYAAQKILGHKDPNVTNMYYADLVSLPEVAMPARFGGV